MRSDTSFLFGCCVMGFDSHVKKNTSYGKIVQVRFFIPQHFRAHCLGRQLSVSMVIEYLFCPGFKIISKFILLNLVSMPYRNGISGSGLSFLSIGKKPGASPLHPTLTILSEEESHLPQ